MPRTAGYVRTIVFSLFAAIFLGMLPACQDESPLRLPEHKSPKFRLDPLKAAKDGILPNVYCTNMITANQCADFYDRVMANPVLREKLLLGAKSGVNIYVRNDFVVTASSQVILDMNASDEAIIDFLSGKF